MEKVFYQLLKIYQIKYDKIQKLAIDQGNNCTVVCLLDYVYFKSYYNLYHESNRFK